MCLALGFLAPSRGNHHPWARDSWPLDQTFLKAQQDALSPTYFSLYNCVLSEKKILLKKRPPPVNRGVRLSYSH